jgi:transcriptional regulator with XRE-family HTH domain
MTITRFPGSQPDPIEQKSAYAFGDVIRKYRARAKYNQRDLAERMGVKQPVVAKIEGGRSNVSFGTLKRYARATGCKVKVEFVQA